MEEQVAPLPPEAMGLVAELVQRNYNDYAAVSQRLIEGLQDENQKLHAELALIRIGISRALDGQFMPTSDYLRGLLRPTREQIAEHVEARREEG